MKKWFMGLVMFLFCILGFTKNVRADVIWEPENIFYKMHADECVYHDRNYIVNGPEEKVTVYQGPELGIKVASLEKGTKVNIYYLYEAKNGTLWGLHDNWQTNITGWVPMDYLDLVYDHICFMEDFGNQMKKQEGQLPQEYTGEEILIWNYPGSEECYTFVAQDPMEYTETFVDEEGNNWAHIGYYYGWRNMWFCTDDPKADFDTLYPNGAPVRDVNQEHVSSNVEEVTPGKGMLLPILIVFVLIAVVVIVTWKLLQKMKNKSLDTKDDSDE